MFVVKNLPKIKSIQQTQTDPTFICLNKEYPPQVLHKQKGKRRANKREPPIPQGQGLTLINWLIFLCAELYCLELVLPHITVQKVWNKNLYIGL